MKKFIINLAVIVGITAYCAINGGYKAEGFSGVLLVFFVLCGIRLFCYAMSVVKEKYDKEEQREKERWERH